MTVPSWLPDWRDPDQYPGSISPHRWAWQFLRRIPEYQEAFTLYSNGTLKASQFMSRYGLEAGPFDPAEDQPLNRWRKEEIFKNALRIFTNQTHLKHWVLPERFQVGVYINLLRPLDEQLEQIKNDLKPKQKIIKKRMGISWLQYQPAFYTVYLRVLDARTCGVVYQEIGDVLYPGDEGDTRDHARKTYKAAVTVMKNYRQIAMKS